MADYLDFDPDQLRVYAEQLDRYAAAMRKWGEIPEGWLKEFPDGYGTIADPMHGALWDYYRDRHDKAEAQAASAIRTRDDLRAAAERMEHSELSGGQQISNTGPHGGPSPVAPHTPGAPGDTAPRIPDRTDNSPESQPMPDATPDTAVPPAGTARSDGETGPPLAATPPPGHDNRLPFATPNIATSQDISHTPPSLEHHHDSSAPAPVHVTSVEVSPLATAYGIGDQPETPTAGAVPPMGPVGPAPAGPPPEPPRPLPRGPLAVSAQPARGHRQGLPPLVVGDEGEDDLTLARTLLAAVLFAVGDTAPGVEWATGVVRSGRRAIVTLTSTEGRGWLPAGLFLPSEVLIPWHWDSILDAEGRTAITTFENSSDPARFLAEFGHHASRSKRGRLRALASSARVNDSVRAALGNEVVIADQVVASETAVDLSGPGAGLSDRLDMGGSSAARQRATEIADSDIRTVCVQLAHAAHELVRQAAATAAPETSAHRARRHRVLEALRAGREVPTDAWDNSPTAEHHDAGASSAIFAPSSVSRPAVVAPAISTASPHPTSDTDIERGRTFERRADELISLLLAGRGDRQMLRDALYAHDQIAAHPQLQVMLRRAEIGSVDVGSAGEGEMAKPADEYRVTL
ncbi:type VII secretion target [Nocardia spumae]|uniref:type VII secretion target n=1 Tax=Nocardia spumae TaxID=2887190 RepID=UPI001D1526DE|nr:type VII secretion target [Nocardia spumae]